LELVFKRVCIINSLEGDRNEQNKYEEKYLEDRFFYFFTIPYYHIHFYYSFIHTHTDEMSHGTISEITKETSRVFGWEIWLFFFKKLPHFFLKSMYFLLLESVACALKEWYLKKKSYHTSHPNTPFKLIFVMG